MAGAATSVVVLDATTDRTVPVEFVGKLDANYYCRGWNSKRAKYCRARAGRGTDHSGTGRCSIHGGNCDNAHLLRHGQRRRRYSLQNHPRIKELIEQYQNEPDPLNVLDELALARALMHDWVDRYETFSAALLAWFDTWEGKYMPLGEGQRAALARVLDRAGEEDASGDVALAREALAFLAKPQTPKPRKLVDLADAMRYVDIISKTIFRVEQARALGMISIDRIRLFLLAIDRVLELNVGDATLRQQIRRDISALRV